MSDLPRATVLALTSDIFLVPRLEDAARSLDLALEVMALPEVEAPDVSIHGQIRLTEPLEGNAAGLIRRVAEDPPALILVDLASETRAAHRSIQSLKTSSATRRVPIVAFGPHVESESLTLARDAGADRVVTRGQLQSSLAEILRREARPPDVPAIEEACRQPASATAREGLARLNAGAYFEAHEHLERAVLDDPGAGGTVYRTLLHLAVACLHVERGNWRGAQKMVLRMQPWLVSLPERCRGVNVTDLRRELQALKTLLDAWHDGGEAPAVPLTPPRIGLETAHGAHDERAL
jgi:CheY-like chemotaxis protein